MASPTDGTADERGTTGLTPNAGAAPETAAAAPARDEGHGGADRIKPIVAEIRERVAELASHELTLRQREQEFEQQYRLLRLEAREAARQEWLDAHERLQRRSAELDAQSVEVSARAARISELERTLAQRRTEVEHVQQQLDDQLQQLRRQIESYNAERNQERLRLRQRVAVIRAREQELERRLAAALQEAAHAQAERKSVESDALAEQQVTLQRRRRRLQNYDQQLRGRAGALDGEARRLAELDAALEQRKAALEALRQDAEAGLQAFEQRREELRALREQVEAREGQGHLSLEVERQEIDKQRATLAAARDELLVERRQREAESEQLRRTLAEQAEHLRRAQRSHLGGSRRWWLRGGLMAAIAGLTAASAWWSWDRPTYRAECEWSVVGVPEAADVLWEHERRLRTPSVMAQVLPDAALRALWAGARIETASRQGAPVLHVTLDGLDAAQARGLLDQVGARYRALAETWPAGALVPGPGAQLLAQREERTRELNEKQTDRAQQQAELDALPSIDQRDTLRTTVARLRADYDEVSRDLAEQRGRLSAMMTAASPHGSVSSAEFDTALAADDMYQEDAREFRAASVQYRSELVVALLLVKDPVQEVQRTVGAFTDAITEQRGLQPPTAVAAVLEQTAADLTAFGEVLTAFTPAWSTRIETVQAMSIDQPVELVKQQQQASEELQKLTGKAGTLMAAIRKRLDELSQNTAGEARTVVVAAVLRDELVKLAIAAAALVKAADQSDVTKNFRLDALDRQLRGLRTRLDRRQTALRQQMQIEADEKARIKQAEQVVGLQHTVDESETRRDQRVAELADKLDELRRLDGQVARRKEIEAAIRSDDEVIARAQREIAELTDQLQAGERNESAAAALRSGPVSVHAIAGEHRLRGAIWAGLAAAAAMLGACVLLLVQIPSRRTGLAVKLRAAIAPAARSPEMEPVITQGAAAEHFTAEQRR